VEFYGQGLIYREPLEEKYSPQSIVDAQFSMPFGAAMQCFTARRVCGVSSLRFGRRREANDKAVLNA